MFSRRRIWVKAILEFIGKDAFDKPEYLYLLKCQTRPATLIGKPARLPRKGSSPARAETPSIGGSVSARE